MPLSQLAKARVVAVAPFAAMFATVPTRSVELIVTLTLLMALLAPFAMLLIRCRKCDEFVISSVHKTPGPWIPVLFFTPALRCTNCGARLGRPDPYEA
jgi:hypothetical protein